MGNPSPTQRALGNERDTGSTYRRPNGHRMLSRSGDIETREEVALHRELGPDWVRFGTYLAVCFILPGDTPGRGTICQPHSWRRYTT